MEEFSYEHMVTLYEQEDDGLRDYIKRHDKWLEYLGFLLSQKKSAKLWLHIGILYFDDYIFISDREKEIECYEKALELDPNEPYANFYIGEYYLKDCNNPSEALSYLIKGINCKGEDDRFLLLADCYLGLNNKYHAVHNILRHCELNDCELENKWMNIINHNMSVIEKGKLWEESSEYIRIKFLNKININITLKEYIELRNDLYKALYEPAKGREYQRAKEEFSSLVGH